MSEEWKDIPEYEGLYQASNCGRIRSLDRMRVCGHLGGSYLQKGRVLKQSGRRYLFVPLNKNRKLKNCTVHRLVASAFLGKSDLQVDHINGNKKDNRLENLEYVTAQENSRRHTKKKRTTSKYTGVSWHKRDKVWEAYAKINGKQTYMGRFATESDANDVVVFAESLFEVEG